MADLFDEGAGTIIDAARYGDVALLERHLASGTSPAAADLDGWTALHIAAHYGKQGIVEVLLKKAGAALLLKRDPMWGRTPLKMARDKGHMEIAALMEQTATAEGVALPDEPHTFLSYLPFGWSFASSPAAPAQEPPAKGGPPLPGPAVQMVASAPTPDDI
mmetsp:Transcript_17253/g.56455  ORF Transcript_17253/g.56455 Transcript_17253/m.56455 type:complete len:161 (+) Transcript_17253:1-483(+)